MKVGDTLICKKDMFHYSEPTICIFKKNNKYKITDTYMDRFYIECEKNIITKCMWVDTIKHRSDNGYYYNDDFYSAEELRQLKLKSL